jgi:hypothetical protein
MHYFTKQSIKMSLVGLGILLTFFYVSDEDFNQPIDIIQKRDYNCNLISEYGMSASLQNIPKSIINHCFEVKKDEYVKAIKRKSPG